MGSVVSPNEYRVGPAASALFMVRGKNYDTVSIEG